MFVIKSKTVTVEVTKCSKRYKLFQVMYGKKDGSLYINFPYFKNTVGVVSEAIVPSGNDYPKKISLVERGKVTSHLVKFSHHPDGRVHFSQDGKVKTEVIKQSVPLNSINGHFFTIQLQGLKAFKETKSKIKSNLKRSDVSFNHDQNSLAAIKFVGLLYDLDNLSKLIEGEVEGPYVNIVLPNGKKVVGIMLSDPITRNPEQVLVIISHEIPKINSNNQPALTFIGGFDPVRVVNNKYVETSFLALIYPSNDFDKLKEQIGCIDYAKVT